MRASRSAVVHAASGSVRTSCRRPRRSLVTSPERSPVAPQLPTVAESGMPGYESLAIYGIFVPARTPRAIVDRLNREIVRLLDAPEMKARLLAMGMETVGGTPERLAARVRSEMQRMAIVAREGEEFLAQNVTQARSTAARLRHLCRQTRFDRFPVESCDRDGGRPVDPFGEDIGSLRQQCFCLSRREFEIAPGQPLIAHAGHAARLATMRQSGSATSGARIGW